MAEFTAGKPEVFQIYIICLNIYILCGSGVKLPWSKQSLCSSLLVSTRLPEYCFVSQHVNGYRGDQASPKPSINEI